MRSRRVMAGDLLVNPCFSSSVLRSFLPFSFAGHLHEGCISLNRPMQRPNTLANRIQAG
jgi:hypothetical protein